MRPMTGGLAGIAIGAALLAAPFPAAAQEWRASGGKAGFAVGDAFDGLWFGCGNGAVRAVFAAPGWNLEDGGSYTVVASVDGTAFVLPSVAMANEATGEDDLVRTATLAELQPFIAALKAGRSVEISGPTGRYTLPLKGSGKALAVLEDACGG